jgi:hypothetical protein
MPGRANRGTNTRAMMTVAMTTAERTSTLASRTRVSRRAGLRASWRARASLRRRRMFSTSTTASSTSSPMAMAMPPRVMVLMERPKYLKTRAVVSTETGMAVREMKVVRKLPRKRNSTAATKTEAASSFTSRLLMEASMKLAWRKVTRGAARPGGRAFSMSARAASTVRVRATVSAAGCFCTDRITAGPPS